MLAQDRAFRVAVGKQVHGRPDRDGDQHRMLEHPPDVAAKICPARSTNDSVIAYGASTIADRDGWNRRAPGAAAA